MPRRINFTGRRKIRRSDVSIRIIQQNGSLSFTADLQLGDYKVAPSAKVHIEAFRSASTLWKRFNFGTVSNFGPQNGCKLDEFGHPEGIRFRVKIASGGDFLGRLLAEADSIRPKLPGEHDQHTDPIIDVAPGAIGDEIWRLDLQDSMPLLIINEKIDDWKNLSRESTFRALVTPMAMRLILSEMLLYGEGLGDDDDEDDWRQRWKRFAETLAGECPGVYDEQIDNPPRQDIQDWIDNAVDAFSTRTRLLHNLIELRAPEAT